MGGRRVIPSSVRSTRVHEERPVRPTVSGPRPGLVLRVPRPSGDRPSVPLTFTPDEKGPDEICE